MKTKLISLVLLLLSLSSCEEIAGGVGIVAGSLAYIALWTFGIIVVIFVIVLILGTIFRVC